MDFEKFVVSLGRRRYGIEFMGVAWLDHNLELTTRRERAATWFSYKEALGALIVSEVPRLLKA